MDLQPGEYISHCIIDSNDRSSGNVFDFVVPANQDNINMLGVDRFAVDSFHCSDFYYDINEFNRNFQVANSVGTTFNISLPVGYYTFTTTTPLTEPAFDTALALALNTGAGAIGTFSVSWSWLKYQYTITCTNPFRFIVPSNRTNEVGDTYGIYTSLTTSTTYITGQVSLLYSGIFYVCSSRLARFNARDVASNPKISNVLFEISVADFSPLVTTALFRNQFQTLKIQNWDETLPLGVIDIYIVDRYGNKLIYDESSDRSNYLQFKLKCVKKYSEQQSKIKSF